MPRFAFIPSNAIASLTLLLTCSWLSAQDTEEIFCENNSRCSPESMVITFPGADPPGASRIEISPWIPGNSFRMQVAFDVESPRVQAWSYGVKHESTYINLIPDSVTTSGTIVDPDHPDAVAIPPMFKIAASAVGDGFISAVVLSFLADSQLPVDQRSVVVNAGYQTREFPGPDGTWIRFADGELGTKNTPPINITLTVDGRKRLPSRLVNGHVTGVEPAQAISFRRGDVDGDGRYTVSDVYLTIRTILGLIPAHFACDDVLDANDDGKNDLSDALPVIQYLFEAGSPLSGPFRTCGLDLTEDGLSCLDAPGCD